MPRRVTRFVRPALAATAATAVTAVAAATALLAALAHPAQAQGGPERHVLRGSLVEIWNLAGRAEVVEGSGPDVVVEVSRRGDDADRLVVEAANGRLVVRYPARDIVVPDLEGTHRWELRLRVREDGSFSGGWGDDTDGATVQLRSSGRGLEASAALRIAVPKGQRVAVHLGAGAIIADGVDADLELRTQLSRIRATNLAGRLALRTGSGRIEAEGFTGQRLEVSTGSGGVELDDVRVQDLRAGTGSGSIDGRGVSADRATFSTGSGRITVEATGDDVTANTGSGSVRLRFARLPRDVQVRTGSGSAEVALPDGVNAEVDLRAGSGGVSSDFAVTVDQVRRNALQGRIGTGADGRIRISTGSGSARLVKR